MERKAKTVAEENIVKSERKNSGKKRKTHEEKHLPIKKRKRPRKEFKSFHESKQSKKVDKTSQKIPEMPINVKQLVIDTKVEKTIDSRENMTDDELITFLAIFRDQIRLPNDLHYPYL